ncbi:MAG: FMN-binding protein [Paludibacteraceae bacterium]|nr:FMN-binding protein [Paludibacteraceae bacterium]
MKKDAEGNYVVETTELGKEVTGFAGNTPLNVSIDANGSVVKVEALENQETPGYFQMVTDELLPKLEGKNAETITQVDAVSGATFSSEAVIKNVQIALDYYQKHK